MAVRRLDHVALDVLAARAQRVGQFLEPDGGYSQSELNAMSSVRADDVAKRVGEAGRRHAAAQDRSRTAPRDV